jgi:glucose 1-dehydrogenase
MQIASLKDKVAIVTGAGQGIGFDIACKLASQGVRVILNDRDEALAQEAVQKIASMAPHCIAIAGDASDLAVIDKMVSTAVEQYGQLDIAIANAGITLFGDFLNYPQESLQQVMQVNLAGTFFLAQRAARQMIAQKSGGSLLFMSSVTGHQAHKDLAAYGMTKAALEMLAKNLVIELSPYQINVNAVAPGATMTERTMDDVNYESVWSQITPMGRPGKTDDIANAVLFLISAEARHITGQSLVIDGGWTAVSPSPF